MDQTLQNDRTSKDVADLVLTCGTCRELKAAMPTLFPNLPISMPPAYQATNWRSSSAASWLARLAIDDEASAHERLAQREAIQRGVVRFETAALRSGAGDPVWFVTERMAAIGAAWVLFGETMALCRLISETHAEAALLVLTPRLIRRTDGKGKIAVYVPRHRTGDLSLNVDGRSGYTSRPFGVFGSAVGKTAQAGIEAARSRLAVPADPELSPASVEAMALWAEAMSVTAEHLIASWDDLPVRMTEAVLASVRPLDIPAPASQPPAQPVSTPAPTPGPVTHRFERVYLETVYWKDRAGAENNPPKAFPCQNGSTSINANTDFRQSVVTVHAHEIDDDLMIHLDPASAWIARRGGSVAATIEPDGQIHLEGVDATAPLDLADVSPEGVISRVLPDGRRVAIYPDGSIHVDIAGGKTMQIAPNGHGRLVGTEDPDEAN